MVVEAVVFYWGSRDSTMEELKLHKNWYDDTAKDACILNTLPISHDWDCCCTEYHEYDLFFNHLFASTNSCSSTAVPY